MNRKPPEQSSLTRLRLKQAARQGKKLKIRQEWRPLAQLPPHVVEAVLLAEDDTFFRHHGFDFQQIGVAVRTNWKKKRFAYGGSTVTQQLARTLYLTPRKNPLRKLKEAVITLWMEAALSKRRILELYLNYAEWGSGIFGIEAAALHYYGKTAPELSAEEAAALASILPSPRRWNPHRVTPFMARRRANLLSRMRTAAPPTPEQKAEEQLEVETEAAPADIEENLEFSLPSVGEPAP